MSDHGPRAASAIPSVRARVLAFVAIVAMGLCGAVIGRSLVRVQCTGNCTAQQGVGAIVGGTMAAVGVAVMAVLTLRAMGEWRRISEEQLLGEQPAPPSDLEPPDAEPPDAEPPDADWLPPTTQDG